MGLTRKNPTIMGIEVPRESKSNNEAESPGKKTCATVENKKADSPKPEMTIPVVVAR